LQLILSLTTYFGQIVNVTAPDGAQIERDVSQQQLNSYQVLVLNAELERFFTPLVLYIGVCSILEKHGDESFLHLFILMWVDFRIFLCSETVIVAFTY